MVGSIESIFAKIHHALEKGLFVSARRQLDVLEPEDIAHLLEASPQKERHLIWQLTDLDIQGEILDELSEEVKDTIIAQMTPDTLADITKDMASDDISYVLRNLPEERYQAILAHLDVGRRQQIEVALAYDENTAGAIMSSDVVTIRSDVNVDVILRYLRIRGVLPENTDTLYVIDKEQFLIGEVSLMQLVTSSPNTFIAEIMTETNEAIPVELSESDVAKRFERRNWNSAPVIDNNKRLIGRITIDDVVDIIREEGEHSMMSMAGMEEDEDTFAPVLKSARRRTIWLGINLLAALAAASVSNIFEDTLHKMAAIAILMTIVPSMGGCAGNQTVALVIRGLALGHISDKNTRWLLIKEGLIGLLNGLLWAITLGGIVTVWKDSWQLGAIIAGAMLANLIVAGLAGVAIPIMLKKLKIDPALAGGMALTTITDMVGLSIFLGLATLFLN
jgi:magnesium transporter